MSKEPQAVPHQEGDEIVPMFKFDSAHHVENFVLTYNYVLPARLSPNKMQDALQTLTSRPGWRKLGARMIPRNAKDIRHVAAGEMNRVPIMYSIPREFTSERPAFRFSQVDRTDTTLKASGTSLPERTNGVSTHDAKGHYKYFVAEGTPMTHKEFMKPEKDHPQLFVHMLRFKDATLLGITIPHSFTDGVGAGRIMSALATVLRGEKPPEFVGYSQDPFRSIEATGGRGNSLVRSLRLWDTVKFVSGILKEVVVYKDNLRLVYLPAAKVRQLHRQCIEELKTEGRRDITFLSQNDVVAALILKLSITAAGLVAHPISDTANFVHDTVCSAHTRLPSLLPSHSPETGLPQTYVHNLDYHISLSTPLYVLANMSLAQYAARVRQVVAENTTERQALKELSFMNKLDKEKAVAAAAKTEDHWRSTTSWLKCGFMTIDWSGAAEDGEVASEAKLLPTFFDANFVSDLFPVDCFVQTIMGQDEEGGIWLKCGMRSKDLETFERLVQEI